jgi:hypothetical protein
VTIAVDPNEDALYYIAWTALVRKVVYNPSANLLPTGVGTADASFGATPLTVQFDGSGSIDPERLPLPYE